jgi:8-oxo-dGTP pyrophosphatase MutT (NUDIX family)
MNVIEVFRDKPGAFNARAEVAGCFVECQGKFLYLQYAMNHRSEGGKWGIPAGKIEEGESLLEGALRELFEETSIKAPDASYLGHLFIRKQGEVEYVFHMFHVCVNQSNVRLSNEHVDCRWLEIEKIKKLPLISGGNEAFQWFLEKLKKNRRGVSVNAYLILRKGEQVLLQLRKNTGYCDGLWSLVAGHVEDGEAASEGMKREAGEEIGIEVQDLKCVHVMHRATNRLNMDVFFECLSWNGQFEIKEPHKCEALEYFPLDRLPENMVDYNRSALRWVFEGKFYSEIGWRES